MPENPLKILSVFVVRSLGDEYVAVWFANERNKCESHAHIYCGREHRLLLRLERASDAHHNDFITLAFRRVGEGWRVVFYEGYPKNLTVYALPHGEQLFTGMKRVEFLGYSRTMPVSRALERKNPHVVDRFHHCWSWLWGPIYNPCVIDMQLVAEGIIDWGRAHKFSQDIKDILFEDFDHRSHRFPFRKITGYRMYA
jgi:hypothetical protein